jgi:hypothetical protein
MTEWTPRQFGTVLDDFKKQCSAPAWKSLLLSWALVKAFGKMCGSGHAKKLVNGDGIWELIGSNGTEKPRPLFYFADSRHEVVFVHAFRKQGDNEYKKAIKLAQGRRRLIERKERPSHVIAAFDQQSIH